MNISLLFPVIAILLTNPTNAKTKVPENGGRVSNIEIYDANLNLSFFPEGGVLISGFVNRIAVTTSSPQDKPLHAVLIDDVGQQLKEFSISTLGLGEFKFIPDFGKTYFIVVQQNDGVQRFELPKVLRKGLFLKMVPFQDHFRVSIRSKEVSFLKGYTYTVRQNDDLVLTGKIVKETPDALVEIPKELLTPGVFEFTLYNRLDSIVAKRMAFNKTVNDPVKMQVLSHQVFDSNKDSVALEISFSNTLDHSTVTCFSIQKLEEINPFLLLTTTANGKLGGNQNTPGFKNDDLLDILMISQIDRPKKLKGSCGTTMKDKGITIEGAVKNVRNGEPLPHAKIGLSFRNKKEIGVDEITTDANGRFSFTELDFYGRTSILVQLKTPSKKSKFKPSDYVIELDSAKTFYRNTKGTPSDLDLAKSKELGLLENEGNQMDTSHVNMANLIKLNEVDIKADKKMAREEMFRKRRLLYKNPSQTIDFAELPQIPFADPLDALIGRIPGLNSTGLRGNSTLNPDDSKPLILLDNTPIDRESGVGNLNFFDIEFIDIIKGPRAAIYGSRAGNGIIAIYSKQGNKTNTLVTKGIQLTFIHPGNARKTPENKTVYKNSYLQLKSGTSMLNFRIPKKTGQYIVLLEGMDPSGKSFQTKALFSVQP